MVLVWSERVRIRLLHPSIRTVLCELRLLPGIRWHFSSCTGAANRCSCLRRLNQESE
jgi:hypothetical protein